MSNFERIKYPDGQIGAKWLHNSLPNNNEWLISERINSYEDLFYVRSIAEVLKANNVKGWDLFIPCMFGQRSDRRFDRFQSFDLKLITDVINDCDFEQVSILDPHSDVTLALINNSKKVSSFTYVSNAVQDIIKRQGDSGNDILLVSPDAGAYKKVYEFGEKLNLPTMGAMKCRVDGIPDMMFTHDVEGKDCLIVDDLCDGGATFIKLGELLREHKARNVYLYVTHGLFSKGFQMMSLVIDHIYCTNSVKDLDSLQAVHIDAPLEGTKLGLNSKANDFITQYKVI